MRAFIVRPFGTKNDKQGQPIDFDAVEQNLIGPALAWHGIEGRTTGEIAAAGNIREDMFRMLIASDVVIADISIHNANVFYELGIRHALRPSRTLLIRCRADDAIFDLQTDRYLEYDREQPRASLSKLVEALAQTLAGERKDSPVYLLLPQLQAPLRAVSCRCRRVFGEAVRAGQGREATGRPRAAWRGGTRLRVGERRACAWSAGRSSRSSAHEGARVTWEAVRESR